ncbi:unnamed protein product [Penicillium nalgiovense]|nr:unnamed protein product [Penicillium nalgiovense]
MRPLALPLLVSMYHCKANNYAVKSTNCMTFRPVLLVAGAMVLALMTPVNVHAARKYTSSQQSLMVARDRKMQVLSEVLQLIRQIKFSAQETRWEGIIGQSREEELRAQWSAFRCHISQLAVYLTTPTLSAPTAFSAIAVLNSIEIVMYALPGYSAAAVEFSNATLGWTGTLPGQAVSSILHGVTLCFPPSKLSLVTGPTGCGKSLLLASTLGESTLLNGTIRGPRDGKYAYVAQVPWYNKVLFACALHQDLSLFPDGDATEVGPNGVNLSGGQNGDNVPTLWPSHGCIQVPHLSVSYAANLPPALHDISFSMNSAERIGVVGRTGFGKSSLILALFRFLEASEGSIVIDGLDISILNLHQLRARLAIVPQNPAVFSSTMRTNLDPFGQHSDDELLAALRDVQWDEELVDPSRSPVKDGDLVSDNESQNSDDDANESSIPLIMMQHTTSAQHSTTARSLLDYPIAANGENLSKGRRQLLCLARAILQRPKLLVLGEATSGIDQETDRKVQASIRRISKLNSMSLLVVAHRLSTVVDFDRILVLSGGHVAEFGNPQELMQRPAGVFRAMMMEHDGEELAPPR